MKPSDIRGQNAVDAWKVISGALDEIKDDKRVKKLLTEKRLFKVVNILLEEHQSSTIAILAALDGENPDGYLEKVTLVTLPARLLEILNDKELMQFFGLQMTQASET